MKRKKIFLALGALFFLCAAWAGWVVWRDGARFWATRLVFEAYLWRDRAELKKQSQSGESNVYYFTSYYLNGLLSAAEATGSRRLMGAAVQYLDVMLSKAIEISYKGQTYLVWGPFNITPSSPVEKPNVHFTLQAAVPLARAAAIIKNNPEFEKEFGDHVAPYTEFVKSAVFDYWYKTEYNMSVPWINTEYVPIWNDNATNMGLCAVFMHEATQDPAYRKIAEDVAEAFKNKLALSGRAWTWENNTIPIGSDTDNTPGSVGNQAGVPDTSHANREAMFIVFAHENGVVYSIDDVQKMAYTFLDNIWNQSASNPSFANYINGSNKPYRVYKEEGLNGPIYHGWALVGGYSEDSQKVLYHTVKAILYGKTNPSLTRNITGYGGMLGLTGHMLRNHKTLNGMLP